jgi:hypothetical protein
MRTGVPGEPVGWQHVVDLRLHRGLVNFGAVFINNDHTTSLIVNPHANFGRPLPLVSDPVAPHGPLPGHASRACA